METYSGKNNINNGPGDELGVMHHLNPIYIQLYIHYYYVLKQQFFVLLKLINLINFVLLILIVSKLEPNK
jgi:hypothetical protein